MQGKMETKVSEELANNRADLGIVTIDFDDIAKGIVFRIILQVSENKKYPFFHLQIFDKREEDTFILNWDLYPDYEAISAIIAEWTTSVDIVLSGLGISMREGHPIFRNPADSKYLEMLNNHIDAFEVEANKSLRNGFINWARANNFLKVPNGNG